MCSSLFKKRKTFLGLESQRKRDMRKILLSLIILCGFSQMGFGVGLEIDDGVFYRPRPDGGRRSISPCSFNGKEIIPHQGIDKTNKDHQKAYKNLEERYSNSDEGNRSKKRNKQ